MDVLRQLRDGLIQIETWLAAASLLLLLCLAVVQILARNLFDTGIAQADSLTRYLVLYVTFFGAAVAVERDRHIKIDVCCVMLPTTALHTLYRPMRAIAALVCGVLAAAAVRFWLDAWQFSPPHERWQVLAALVIPVGFALLTLQFALAALLGQDQDSCSTS
jgi:TRAP-type C4-dicarboxylate transport system permease small subunit